MLNEMKVLIKMQALFPDFKEKGGKKAVPAAFLPPERNQSPVLGGGAVGLEHHVVIPALHNGQSVLDTDGIAQAPDGSGACLLYTSRCV